MKFCPKRGLLLKLVSSVEIRERGLFPLNYLVVAEETLQFYFSRLLRVGSMYNVLLKTHTVRAAYRARRCIASVSRPCQRAHCCYCIYAFEAEGHHGGYHHGVLNLLEEGFSAQMGIMFCQHLVSELHQFHTAYL